MSDQDQPHILCIDVGGHANIGWANSDERSGGYVGLAGEMKRIGELLNKGQRVALGFEAPVWTPSSTGIEELTRRRGGFEGEVNRAWSASSGACVLAANLALMPWCFREIVKQYSQASATVRLDRFDRNGSSLLIWEAFVSGPGRGIDHQDDARLACKAFVNRWPNLETDIPAAEYCINHAVSAALASRISIKQDELDCAAVVVGVRKEQ